MHVIESVVNDSGGRKGVTDVRSVVVSKCSSKVGEVAVQATKIHTVVMVSSQGIGSALDRGMRRRMRL